MKKTILIVTKHPESKGGVVNYYNHFFEVFDSQKFQLKWFTIGSRPKDYNNRSNRKLSYFFEFIKDVFSFIKLLFLDKSIHIVQVSPSFIPVSMCRDMIYLLVAKLYRKKTITFIRGWSLQFENRILKKPGFYKYIIGFYKKSDVVLILAEKFKKTLISLDFISERIHVTRTMYVESDIIKSNKNYSDKPKFLFIGRLSFQKGIVDIIDAAKLLNEKNIQVDVEIYGHYANKEIKAITESKIQKFNLSSQVKINDFISGKSKYQKLAEADVFLFPTYDEGCPNSIIEALAAGLFVISTPIGAIDELVTDERNGMIIETNNPVELAESMLWPYQNLKEVRDIGKLNAIYALENFEQKVIVNQIHKIYNNIF